MQTHSVRQKAPSGAADPGAPGGNGAGLDFSQYRVLGTFREPRIAGTPADAFLTATIEQMPGGQSRGALAAMLDHLRNGATPDPVTLLTPIAITSDNIDQAERLGEIN